MRNRGRMQTQRQVFDQSDPVITTGPQIAGRRCGCSAWAALPPAVSNRGSASVDSWNSAGAAGPVRSARRQPRIYSRPVPERPRPISGTEAIAAAPVPGNRSRTLPP